MYPIHPIRPIPSIKHLATAPRSRVPVVKGGSLENQEDDQLRSSEFQSVVNDFNQLRDALHQRNTNMPELANRVEEFLMWADQVRYNVRTNQSQTNRINDMMRMITTIWNERLNPVPEPISKLRGGMISEGDSIMDEVYELGDEYENIILMLDDLMQGATYPNEDTMWDIIIEYETKLRKLLKKISKSPTHRNNTSLIDNLANSSVEMRNRFNDIFVTPFLDL
jgi:uncharacterized phage infection (PIP) family protein YhgE